MKVGTERQGFKIEIDTEKLDALFSKILGRPQKAPTISFEERRKTTAERIEKIEAKGALAKFLKKKVLQLVKKFWKDKSHLTLATYDPKDNRIRFYFSNWYYFYFEDRYAIAGFTDNLALQEEIIRVLAHECGHALGHLNNTPLSETKIHKWITDGWLYKLLNAGLMTLASALWLGLYWLLIKIISFMFSGIFYLAAFVAVTTGAAMFYMLIITASFLWLAHFSNRIAEKMAYKLEDQLSKKYLNEFWDIVTVTKT